jgi:hypothetical protein
MTRELDPTTYDVLDHIARYRIGVPEALIKTPPFADYSPARAKRTLRALSEAEGEPLLASAPLFGDHRYFYLTRAGEAAIGEPPEEQGSRRRAGALSEIAKVRAYGVLAFCCLSDRPRQRLTLEEFRRNFPEHHRPGLPMAYYADYEAKRLGFVRVDAGGRGRWDRIAEKLREDIERHREMPAFRGSIAAGTFELALVTATERKAERLRPLFEEEARASGVPIRVHVLPELLDLIAPLPRS